MSNKVKKIDRYSPEIKTGLTAEQVQSRLSQGLTNNIKAAVGKSYTEIIFTNVFSFFNILLFVIAGFMIAAKYYSGLFFLAVLIPNIIIGLYEDIKAKRLLSKLRLMTQPTVKALRGGAILQIGSKDIVLDDILIVSSGSQICTDGVVVEGEIAVNESLLTGESLSIHKRVGDKLFAGSYVVSGQAKMHATSVGDDNYVASLQKSANKFKRSPSKILKSLNGMFRVIGIVVIIIAACTIAVYASQGSLTNTESINKSIGYISGSMVSMIPSGLYLLTSMALASAVVALAKKKAQVQDFYSVEMLARVDCLCVDKTGTITDGTMKFRNMVLIGGYSNEEIKQIVSNVLIATNDDNFTAKALRAAFNYQLTTSVIKAMPFNSEYKCSGATFTGNKTYVLGAPEFMNIQNKDSVLNAAKEFTSCGYRVLLLAEATSQIGLHQYDLMKPLALLVLQDHIKEDAIETFKWFADNGVEIKVISGDNAVTTSEVAKQAGIKNASNYISLEGMSIEEVKAIATKYTVFGRVTPEQKEAIVLALKEAKKTVAMTGDGVNDILALKRADCSIAMAAGSDAARNVSHLVLLDSNFSHLPDVVAEGRRVINNLQRTCSVFLVKTIFAVILSIAFLITSLSMNAPSIRYEFLTNTMYCWEILGIGLPAFFLALQRNKEQINGSFIRNILRKAIPGAIMAIVSVVAVYVLFILHASNTIYTGVPADVTDPYRSETAKSMAVILYSLLSLVVLFKVCQPFDLYRKIVFACAATAMIGWIGGSALYYFLAGGSNILLINFDSLMPINYVEIAIIFVVLASIYLAYTYIVEICKGEHIDENKSRN